MKRKLKVIWQKEEFEKAVNENETIAGVLRSLGRAANDYTGSYKMIHRHVKIYNTDTSHWTGLSHLQGKRRINIKKTPVEEMFCKDSAYTSGGIRRRAIRENLVPYKCKNCGITDWDKKPLPLELDHINGDRFDHRLENLRFLCPNCHAQTDTYCGKNIKKTFANNPARIAFQTKKELESVCECGLKKEAVANVCHICFAKIDKHKIEWPDDEILVKMIKESNFWQVGKKLGVSDNAVRKHLKEKGLPEMRKFKQRIKKHE